MVRCVLVGGSECGFGGGEGSAAGGGGGGGVDVDMYRYNSHDAIGRKASIIIRVVLRGG
eukprot:COSAG05_NODE_19491_length_292_cov_0.217617_1_plen_58_part_01